MICGQNLIAYTGSGFRNYAGLLAGRGQDYVGLIQLGFRIYVGLLTGRGGGGGGGKPHSALILKSGINSAGGSGGDNPSFCINTTLINTSHILLLEVCILI